jgi:hypothetical protein
MSISAYRNENKVLTILRQKDRRAVEAGRAYWLHSRDKYVVEVSQPTTAPKRHIRKRFGEGLGERNPVYRAPADFDSMTWWAEQNGADEAREIARMEEAFIAQSRLDSGLDAY